MTAGLAQVLTGWTGSATVTVGGLSVTVTPRDFDSVASVLSRLVERAEVVIGGTWEAEANASSVLTLSASQTFTVTTTSNTATRLAIATGSGASSYTGTGAYTGALTPARGLSVLPASPVTTRGRMTGDGSMAVPGVPAPGAVRLVVYDTHAGLWADEGAVGGVYDVWHLASRRVLVRLRVTESRRYRQGKLASDGLALELVGAEVAR